MKCVLKVRARAVELGAGQSVVMKWRSSRPSQAAVAVVGQDHQTRALRHGGPQSPFVAKLRRAGARHQPLWSSACRGGRVSSLFLRRKTPAAAAEPAYATFSRPWSMNAPSGELGVSSIGPRTPDWLQRPPLQRPFPFPGAQAAMTNDSQAVDSLRSCGFVKAPPSEGCSAVVLKSAGELGARGNPSSQPTTWQANSLIKFIWHCGAGRIR